MAELDKLQGPISLQEIEYDILHIPSTTSEGSSWWNTDYNTLNLATGYGTTLQVGQEIHIKVYNGSGGTISDGDAVYPLGSFQGFPSIGKAITRTHESTQVDFGMATSTMADGEWGFVTWFGKVHNVDTSAYSLGDAMYISPTTAGEMTSIKPSFPDYAIQIGIVFAVHAADGVIFVTGRNTPKETIISAWDGSIREGFDFTVSSNGTVITGSLANKDNTRDLTLMFSDGFTLLDTTPAATLVLTAGTDSNPQKNFVYVDQATKTLQHSTSDWPVTEHTRVAYLLLRSATSTQTEDAFVNQNWNDHVKATGNNGHLLHMAERLREEAAKWKSGVQGTCTIGGLTTVDISVTAGNVFQLHKQSFPALDTATGDNLHIVNDSTTPFRTTSDLETQLTDAAGVSLLNSSFSFVLWGVQNKTGETSHLMINVPLDTYSRLAPGYAVSDANNHSVYTIPNEYSSVGFLIARFTFQLTSGGDWTLYDTQDLRGFQPNNAAGGGSGGSGATEFTALIDTPSAYTSQATKLIQVNAGERALEFTDNLLHIQNTDYQITFDSTPLVIEGTIEILNLASSGFGVVFNSVNDYVTQTFRNEDTGGGVYMEAFNQLYLWIAGPTDVAMQSKLYRGASATGEVISTRDFNCPGNGTWVSVLGTGDVITAADLEIFTGEVTYISGTGDVSVVQSDTVYTYLTEFNGSTYNTKASALLLRASDINILLNTGGQVITTAESVETYGGTTGGVDNIQEWYDSNNLLTAYVTDEGSFTSNFFRAITTDFVEGSVGSAITIQNGASTGNTYSEIAALTTGDTVWGDLVLQRSGGHVGIGTTSPTQLLTIKNNGVTSYATLWVMSDSIRTLAGIYENSDSSGALLINNASTLGVNLQSNANSTFTNTVTATDFILSSDKRLKDNISYGVPSVDGLLPVSYQINGNLQYGFIAQDMLHTHSQLVNGTGKEIDGKIDYYSIKQNSIIAMLVQEVHALKAQIKTLI